MKLIFAFMFFAAFPLWADADRTQYFQNKKVLLLGIDGVQYQHLEKLPTPNFDRLKIQKAFAGGVEHQQTEQATASGPAWTTIMTGVWANKHGVSENSSGLANPSYPGLYRRIYSVYPNAKMYGFVTWKQTHVNYFGNDLMLLLEENNGSSDLDNLDKTLAVLENKAADFIFLHFDDVDNAGHAYCFSAAYDEAIKMADQRLGQVLDAIEKRTQLTQFEQEDWLVLVVSDHGRDADGCSHGAQTENEKTVFIASNKDLNKEFTDSVSSPVQDFNGLYNFPAQTSVAPTILSYLGIPIKKEWLLEGQSLLGDLGVRKVMEGKEKNSLVWYVEPELDQQVQIFRNGEFVVEIPFRQGNWQDKNPLPQLNDYTLVMNDVATSYRIKKYSRLEKLRFAFDKKLNQWLAFLSNLFSPVISWL